MMLVTWTTTRRGANEAEDRVVFIATMGGAGGRKRATIKRFMQERRYKEVDVMSLMAIADLEFFFLKSGRFSGLCS